MKPCGNKACNMRHIYHKHCTVCVCNISHCFKINFSWISGSTCNHKFRFNFINLLCKFLVINKSVFINTVRYKVEILTADISR